MHLPFYGTRLTSQVQCPHLQTRPEKVLWGLLPLQPPTMPSPHPLTTHCIPQHPLACPGSPALTGLGWHQAGMWGYGKREAGQRSGLMGIRGLGRVLCAGSPGTSFLGPLCPSHWVTRNRTLSTQVSHTVLPVRPVDFTHFQGLGRVVGGGVWDGEGRRLGALCRDGGFSNSLTPSGEGDDRLVPHQLKDRRYFPTCSAQRW